MIAVIPNKKCDVCGAPATIRFRRGLSSGKWSEARYICQKELDAVINDQGKTAQTVFHPLGYVRLDVLDKEHPLRNKSLHEISARWRHNSWQWHYITKKWGIGEKCYNDLGVTWTRNTEWEALIPEEMI